jgi:hypothetical protein
LSQQIVVRKRQNLRQIDRAIHNRRRDSGPKISSSKKPGRVSKEILCRKIFDHREQLAEINCLRAITIAQLAERDPAQPLQ